MQINPYTVEWLYDTDLLLARGRAHEHWRPHNCHYLGWEWGCQKMELR